MGFFLGNGKEMIELRLILGRRYPFFETKPFESSLVANWKMSKMNIWNPSKENSEEADVAGSSLVLNMWSHIFPRSTFGGCGTVCRIRTGLRMKVPKVKLST